MGVATLQTVQALGSLSAKHLLFRSTDEYVHIAHSSILRGGKGGLISDYARSAALNSQTTILYDKKIMCSSYCLF